MCGLVGVIGKPCGGMDKFFRTLLVLDTVRGEHSTGVLFVDTNGTTEVHKKVGNPYELFDSRAYNLALAYANNVLMGHNRWASVGKVNTMNAHPFEHGNITGAHNGTIFTKYKLDDDKDFEVDSDNIFYHLDRNGVEATCKVLGGAFALTWYDSSKNTMNFVRNDQRSFFYAYTKDKKNLVWASEKWMLEVSADKNKISLGNIISLPTHKHHSIFVPLETSAVYPQLGKLKVTEVEEYIAPKKFYPTVKDTSTSMNTGTGGVASSTSSIYWQLLKTEVDFVVVDTHPMLKGVISVRLTEHPNVIARIICKKGTSIHKKLMANIGVLYTGIVKRVGVQSSWTVTIDKDTIEEATYVDEWSEGDVEILEGKYPIGYPTRHTSRSEWEREVAKGCAWCSDVPQGSYEAKFLVWYSDTDHVCEDCSSKADVKQYLHL